MCIQRIHEATQVCKQPKYDYILATHPCRRHPGPECYTSLIHFPVIRCHIVLNQTFHNVSNHYHSSCFYNVFEFREVDADWAYLVWSEILRLWVCSRAWCESAEGCIPQSSPGSFSPHQQLPVRDKKPRPHTYLPGHIVVVVVTMVAHRHDGPSRTGRQCPSIPKTCCVVRLHRHWALNR